MMYASPFANQQQQQHTTSTTPVMNGDTRTTIEDKMSYKERFHNNFNKFALPSDSHPPPPSSSSRKNSITGITTNNNNDADGTSHLHYLFDKAQGVTPGLPIPDRTTNNGYHRSDSSTCSRYLTDPQSAIKYQPPGRELHRETNGSMTGGLDKGGSISGRAVPATPEYLKADPLSSLSLNNSPTSQMRSTMSPSMQQGGECQFNKFRPSSETSMVQPRRSINDDGSRKPESTSEEYYPCRPSFEQTRRHWVYTPKMARPEESKPVERQKHPGARSRPLPEYLNFRKFSVPLISPRPKVEVKQQAVDDQMPTKEMKPLAKSDIDSSSVHQLLREGDELSHYDENSIRYTGRTNPSKVFQLLQCATGSQEDILVSKPPARRRSRKPAQEVQVDADDIVDITYIGGNIPSRTFQCLKDAFDDKDARDPFSSTECLDDPVEPARSIKVIHLRPRKSIDDGITAL